MAEKGFTVDYSFKEIMDKLEEQDNTLSEIHNQVKRTNGRVTSLEKTSLGKKIGNNPFKFALIVMAFFSLVISDIRHPVMNLVTTFLGF